MAKERLSREEYFGLANQLAQKFAERAAKHDAEGSFPFENFEDLRATCYPSLTVPTRYGGWGAGLTDSVQVIEILGSGDGSTALSFTMHVQTIGAAATKENWDKSVFEDL